MESSGEYTVEYKFTADVKGLEAGVKQVQSTIKTAASTAKDFGSEISEGFYQAVGSINDLDGKTQALLASITALEAVFVKDSLASFAQYEDAVYGMATTVGNVGGTISQAMESIRETTANGLLSETDAARAINNLTSYGYSVQEVTQLIQELANVSMAHRNESISVSEQVEKLTEGIKRGSSQMLKANGLMTTASGAAAAYASSIGKTADELTDAERRQAMLNAVVDAGNSSMAIAEVYENSYSASVQRLNNSMDNLKVAFGEAIAPLMTWIANAAAWVVQNKQLVLGIGTFVGVLVGSGGVFVALAKIIPAIRSAVAWFNALSAAGKGLVGVLAAVATTAAIVATVAAINSMSTGLEGIAESSGDAASGMDDFTASVGGGGGGGGATGAVRDLSKELAKLERQYLDELKTIENRHQETIDKLTKQIQEANVDYRRAVEERNAEFEVQQAKEEKKHQEKVDEIMTQIRFLQRYNNDYNKQKLANLEFALAKENALYQKQTEAAKAELELQNENDRIAYEKKRSEMQAELDDELAFMNKHREDLKKVQGWILEDEIEALNRRYQEQQESYDMQAGAAAGAGSAIAQNLADNFKKTIQDYDWYGLGNGAGTNFGTGIAVSFQRVGRDISEWWARVKQTVFGVGNGVAAGSTDDEASIRRYFQQKFGNDWQREMERQGYGSQITVPKMFASGGYTGSGSPNDIAGLVHKGEYVLPQEMVDQSTGTPKALGNTYNIYLNGTFATSAAERRKVADQIVAAINQNNKSRLEAAWQ